MAKKDHSFEESRRVWHGGFRGYKSLVGVALPTKGKTAGQVIQDLSTWEARGIYTEFKK